MLDYPPFFAYFEMCLGILAKHLLPSSQFWSQSSYADVSIECRTYQKISVIISDLILYLAIL